MNFARIGKFLFASLLPCCFFCLSDLASAQLYNVDCSGNTPGAYTTINSVLPLLTNGSQVMIVGTCTENVSLNNLNNVYMGAPWGQTMNLQGNLFINGSLNLILYGMNVTNASGDGIDVQNSLGISLEACTSTNNAGVGLNVWNGSAVSVADSGSYSNNANDGIYAQENSIVEVNAWSSPILVSNNMDAGVHVDRSVFEAEGISITQNKIAAGAYPFGGDAGNATGNGIRELGASRVLLGGWGTFPNTIAGNQGDGISLQENSEISLSGPSALPANIVQGNGPVGISVGYGSQLTLYDNVQLTNHADAGVDVYGNSQAFIYGTNQITNNGTDPSYAARAGVRVDGNSEAYLRGGQISHNGGPGILALVNSSLDFTGVTFTGNSGGPVACDSSSWMGSDLAGGNPNAGGYPGALMTCRTPNNLGNRTHAAPVFDPPDLNRLKALEAQYQQLMTTPH
jgi:hypothetical protein